jgi:hypothetical protein
MAFKRLSGRKNLLLDLLLTTLITYVWTPRHILNDASPFWFQYYVLIIFAFLLFFIWSWKPRYIQNEKLVRTALHIIFWTFFVITVIMIIVLISNPEIVILKEEKEDPKLRLWMTSISSFWLAAVAVKYKKLFFPKKEKQVTEG